MLRRIWTTNLAALASVFFLSLQHPVFAQVQPRITAPVDDSVRVAVRGSTPAIHGALDLGAIQDGTPLDHLLLILSMSDKQQNEAITLLDSQQTRGSAHYHEWLTPEEFGLRFGPAPQDIKAITAWLGTQGLRINTIARSGLWIDFSGTAGQVKRAFGTSMHTYRVGNGNYIANAGEVSIPAALAPAIRGIASLNNFYRRRPLHAGGVQVRQTASGTYEPIPGQTVAAGPNGPVNFLSPGDFAKIYDLNPLYQGNIAGRALDGTGQSIAIVSRSDINLQDVADFRSLFGLPAGTPSVINVGPDVPFNPQNGDAVEAALDVEWAGAVAPGANIQMVVAGSTLTDGVDLSAAYIVDNDLAPIVSVSFGACERALGPAANQFYSALWQQAAAQGMSVFVASGDAGAAGCDQPT
ncbi:MAG: protease pro-enzyme activation domain-containing protein, partial [Actinomycetota bacterium]